MTVVEEAWVFEYGVGVLVVDGLEVLLRGLGLSMRAVCRESVVGLLALCGSLVGIPVDLLCLHDVQAVAVVLEDLKAAVGILEVLAHREAVLLHRLANFCVARLVFELMMVVLAAVIEAGQVAIIVLRNTVERH